MSISNEQLIFSILTVLGAHILVIVSPGPNFLVSAKHGMSYPRLNALYTTTGIATGTLIYLLMGFLGLSVILAQSVIAYTILRFVGAVYLIYLGVCSIQSKTIVPNIVSIQKEIKTDIPFSSAFRIGLLTNLVNPKAALYYLSLFSSLITPSMPLIAKLVLITLLPAISWSWYSIVALSFSARRFKQLYSRSKRWIDIPFGMLMIILGLKIMLIR